MTPLKMSNGVPVHVRMLREAAHPGAESADSASDLATQAVEAILQLEPADAQIGWTSLASPAREESPHVLHIATRYLRGGSERRIRDIIRSLPEAHHHLIVGLHSDLELARRQVRPASVTILPTLVRDPSPAYDGAALRSIVHILNRHRFDLVITHQSKSGVLGRIAARWQAGLPVVHSLSMASFGPGYPKWQHLLFRSIESQLHRLTDAYAVVGSDLADRYAGIGIPTSKLKVIRSCVRLTENNVWSNAQRRVVRRRFGLPVQRPIVLSVSSLEARKRPLELVPYLTRLLRMEGAHRPYLVVAGDGPLRRQLVSALRSKDLTKHAAVIGFVEDPTALIAAADVMVLVSRSEGLPQALVQAAAVGTPFVASAVDGVRELIRLGAEGAVVPLDGVAAAAEATARIVGREPRPKRPSIDLTSWSPRAIREGYRTLIGKVMATRWAHAGDRSW